jgi:hypothetical protein
MKPRAHDPHYLDFWLGFAFGSLGVAAFIAGAWANGYLKELIP